ncbi:hypothetical protein ST47_g1095 [Ascochyta rabiei]|uniref:Transferase n=1 Tax=Didymella rabiei TaxID=5454 RepID=A0A163LFI6_DIDRA|nr:hypothetical protein ST47_g1095 [Ascochyta rabiei]
MAGDAMQAMPMSPRQSPTAIGGAAVQWLCSRRGRTLLLSVIVLTFVLGLAGIRHPEAITEQYHALSDYQWRPYLTSLPKLSKTPFKAPSNTTLQLENGEIDHLPPKLEKSTPNFHLLMTSEKDSDAFCKSTLSAMLLNYPPPTAVNFRQTFTSPEHKEEQTIYGIREYLDNAKLVHDEDLLLIVDGQDTWFQLPSDVIIKQYEAVVEYANVRLLKKYGLDGNKQQRFNQTIVFGAEKVCEGDDMACRYAPQSIMPDDMYGASEEGSTEDRPARYLNSKAVMGPAKDLRALFEAALKKYEEKNNEKQTMQSVLATMFGEQQLRRDAVLRRGKSAAAKLREWAGKAAEEHVAAERRVETANITLHPETQYEFSIGLDYTHTLFQPLVYSTLDELVPLVHKNSTDLSKYRHPNTITPHLSLPSALLTSTLPFWSPSLYLNNPSPHTNKPAYIDELEYVNKLDQLPNRHTSWSNIPLIQNTYTGAIPALILRVPDSVYHPRLSAVSSAQIAFNNLWFTPYKRALLRKYFRTPQSPNGYHDSLVGGDRFWDQRGGRGGIWTAKEQIWLPWGEVDGVCGTLGQLKQIFDDGWGVWMHELKIENEAQRLKDEEAYRKTLDDKKKKEREREKVKMQIAVEMAKQEHEQKEREKHDRERLEEVERQKKAQEENERQKKAQEEKERQKKAQEEKERQKKAQEEKETANLERLKEVERVKQLEAAEQRPEESEEVEAASTRHERRWAA